MDGVPAKCYGGGFVEIPLWRQRERERERERERKTGKGRQNCYSSLV